MSHVSPDLDFYRSSVPPAPLKIPREFIRRSDRGGDGEVKGGGGGVESFMREFLLGMFFHQTNYTEYMIACM